MIPHYIALDIEAGGLELQHTLLTAFFLVLDREFNEVAELYLAMKPDGDKPYVLDAEAMGVNGIDIVKHDVVADPISLAGQHLYQFLKHWSDGGKIKLVPVGHGVVGDLNHIWHSLLRRKSFEQFTSYRKIDTGSVTQFLKTCGTFPEEVSGSLQSLLDHFGIDWAHNSHEADADTRATVEVLKALVDLEIHGIYQKHRTL
jgi:DNA polymerase III alpha subunit (gram-positive type)